MRSYLIAACLLVSGWANALTLSPMKVDELVYTDFYLAHFSLFNTSHDVVTYDVWVSSNDRLKPEEGLYKGEEVLGGEGNKVITVPIYEIPADTLEVYYVCVQERPLKSQLSVVGKVCAKVRVYWPRSELQTLQ